MISFHRLLPPPLVSIAFKDIGRQPITPRCINQSNSAPFRRRRGVGKRILNFVRDQSEIGPVLVRSRVLARPPTDWKRHLDESISGLGKKHQGSIKVRRSAFLQPRIVDTDNIFNSLLYFKSAFFGVNRAARSESPRASRSRH